jgi:hypothetical protein
MTDRRILAVPTLRLADIRTGLLAGLAGGAAEIGVVGLYSAISGTDGSAVARAVATTAGFTDPSATMGVVVHMAIAAALGVALTVAWRGVGARLLPNGVFPVMLASLALVWTVNFFVVLPAIGSGFATMLPYAVTLASKLAFGAAAALSLHLAQREGRRQILPTVFHAAA